MSRWTETQALTRAAPTLVTEGMDLRGLRNGFRVMVSAQSGATLTDVNLKAWLRDDTLGWVRSPQLDLAQTAVGTQHVVFPDQPTFVGLGRVLYANNGTTVSAGTTADVSIQGF
jgi:hypothetical protein